MYLPKYVPSNPVISINHSRVKCVKFEAFNLCGDLFYGEDSVDTACFSCDTRTLLLCLFPENPNRHFTAALKRLYYIHRLTLVKRLSSYVFFFVLYHKFHCP